MRLNTLDSLRGIFAVMIVFLHGNYQANLFYSPLVRNSYVAVDFFFVLSGFVISMAYLDRIYDWRAFIGFVIRRIGRLWPLHAAIAIIFIALTATRVLAAKLGLYQSNMDHSLASELGYLVENLLLVHSFRNANPFWLNFPSWSISAELFAYLAFGALCLTGARLALLGALTLVLFGAFAWDLIDPGFGHSVGNGLHRAICYFLLGTLCFGIWRPLKDAKLPAVAAIECALVAVIILQIWFLSSFKYVLPFTFAVAIFVFAYQAGPVSRILNMTPFLALGKWSYSIYMVHALVYAIASLLVSLVEKKFAMNLRVQNPTAPDGQLIAFGPPLLMDAMMLALAGISILLAKFSFHLVECPGREAARKLAVLYEDSWQLSKQRQL